MLKLTHRDIDIYTFVALSFDKGKGVVGATVAYVNPFYVDEIEQAVNGHDALVAALRAIMDAYGDDAGASPQKMFDIAEAALKAMGKCQ